MSLSPFRFPGGKNRILTIIMEQLSPLLDNSLYYCEPFVGGASVALAVAKKYPNINLVLNDKDYLISSFWKIVAEGSYKLTELLLLMEQPATIEHFYKLSEALPIIDIEAAYQGIFFNRCCFSGIQKNHSPIGGRQQLSKYKVNCRYNFKKLKEKILYCNKLLSGRTIVSNLDFSKIINDYPSYIDPPYVGVGKSLYNEYMVEEDHNNLADYLKQKDNWVLSYDNCEIINKLYSFANIKFIDAKYSINGSKNSWKHCKEVLITKC